LDENHKNCRKPAMGIQNTAVSSRRSSTENFEYACAAAAMKTSIRLHLASSSSEPEVMNEKAAMMLIRIDRGFTAASITIPAIGNAQATMVATKEVNLKIASPDTASALSVYIEESGAAGQSRMAGRQLAKVLWKRK
jgi:hypothetical protein